MKISVFLFALFGAAAVAGAQESYGTIKSTTKLRADGSTSTTILDPEKRTAEETITDARGKMQKKITYILGERDLAIGAIFYDAKGNVVYKASYQRDAVGRVIESAFTSPDGRYLGKRTFAFGAGDTVTRMEDYDANGVLITRPQAVSSPGTTTKKRR